MNKVLFIAPKFFGYWSKIKDEIETRGCEVFYINQSLSTKNFCMRIIDRYGYDRIRSRQNYSYYYAQVKKLPIDIRFVFVIKGDSLNPKIMKMLHERYKQATFVMYQWDSVSNSPNVVDIASYFDKIYSFDRNDAEKYSWEYRPLFFDIKDCLKVEKKYDISYICTLKFKRADIYKQIKKISIEKGLCLFHYLYIDLKTYIKRVLFNRDKIYLTTPIKDVRFNPLSLDDTANIYNKSKIIVDYTTPTQNGLSMRTIECLGHNCKIITNNKNIIFEKFYSPQNVILYDDVIEIPDSFINSEYEAVEEKILYYYSLQGWVDTILGGNTL